MKRPLPGKPSEYDTDEEFFEDIDEYLQGDSDSMELIGALLLIIGLVGVAFFWFCL